MADEPILESFAGLDGGATDAESKRRPQQQQQRRRPPPVQIPRTMNAVAIHGVRTGKRDVLGHAAAKPAPRAAGPQPAANLYELRLLRPVSP